MKPTFGLWLVILHLSTSNLINAQELPPRAEAIADVLGIDKAVYVPKCQDPGYRKIIRFYVEKLPVLKQEIERLKQDIKDATAKGVPVGNPETAGIPAELFVIPVDLDPRAFWDSWHSQATARAEYFKHLEQPSLRQALPVMEGSYRMLLYAIREADKQGLKYDEFKRLRSGQN